MQTIAPIKLSTFEIKKNLYALLAGAATSEQVNALIKLAHALAKASLARKNHVQMLVEKHGLNLSDIAYDCIADLFARDEIGHFPAFESYFSAFELSELGDEELIVEFQHLVFGKVKHGIFRLYREIDPQLGRILRNIGASVMALGHFENVLRLGEPCLVPVSCDSLEELPTLDTETLSEHLTEVASGREFIPELVGKIALFLKKQNDYSRIISYVTLALAIRSFYSRKQMLEPGEPVVRVDETTLDTHAVISSACEQTKARLKPKFVTGKRVDEQMFDLYFKVIERCVVARFIDHDGEAVSLVGCLMSHMPSLSIEEVKKEHKNRLEYLARVVNNAVSRELIR